MPTYKRQHYVPQFYLKNFAVNDKIYAYNLKTKRANLVNCRDACSKDYFYAQMPDVERGFSKLEGECNRIISNIIMENSLSKITTEDYILLLFYISFQSARTLRGKQEAEQFINGISSHFFRTFIENNLENFKQMGIEEEYLDKCGYIISGPIHAFAIKSIMERGPFLIRDLKPILFVNSTKRDLVTSDNPIVLYNSFFNNPKGHFLYPFICTTGLQSPGLQIFWPLNTKHMLVLYDKEFYDFRNELNEYGEICLEEDIDALNSLQFFNCSDNIFFANNSQEEVISRLHSKYEPLINKEYKSIDTIKRTKSNGQESEIVISYTRDIDYQLVLSFMYFKMEAKAIDWARDPNIAEFLENHFKDEEEQFDRLFYLGELAVTNEADRILFLEKPKEDLLDLLKKHVSGDWGEINSEEKDRNDKAVEDGSRILSAYTLSTGKKIIILTEAVNKLGHRTITKILASTELC